MELNDKTNAVSNSTEEKKKKKFLPVIIAIIVIVAAVVAVLFFFPKGDEEGDKEGFSWDTNAEEGGLTQRSEEEIQAELNEKVEEGMINISMNTSPVFPSGSEAGDLLIVNNDVNRWPQVVYIIRNDTKEEIYRSGGIS